MDINFLLSPQDTSHGRSHTFPKAQPPEKSSSGSGPASYSSNVNSSPYTNVTVPAPSSSHNGLSHSQASMSSPSLMSPPSALRGNMNDTPPTDPGRLSSQRSATTGMDTLADLASMQHHQQTVSANAGSLRSTGIYNNKTAPQSLSPRTGTDVCEKGVIDTRMNTFTPSTYATNTLSEGDVQTVVELDEYLRSNPHAYESHVRLIELLHQGFMSHCRTGKEAARPPYQYDLLPHLRNARQSMSARFALGEAIWLSWIEDEQLLAESLEDILSVIELCQKSVEQEPSSVELWLAYGEWMLSAYRIANPRYAVFEELDTKPVSLNLSNDDLLVAKSSFTWEQVTDVWNQGTRATKWRINDGHLIWDRYTDLCLQRMAFRQGLQGLHALQSRFLERLAVPHATWDQTMEKFSNFMSAHDSSNYEATMVHGTQLGSVAKSRYSMRETWETRLEQARSQGNLDEEWVAFASYIEWELSLSRRKNLFDFDLAYALYQRATLRFPTDTSLWEGFVMLVNDEFSSPSSQNASVLSILELATRHCPWSGTLWSQYLVNAEREARPFAFMEQIKHRATSTGTLDAGGLEEVIKVHTTWGGVLRRRAFSSRASDEDLDIAEVGIRSAIEDMENLGRSTHGKDYQGDPSYRLERIYIRYLTQRHSWSAARETWKRLVPRLGDNNEFWLRYYLWEMGTYAKLTHREGQPDKEMPKPTEATKVLQQALKRPKLDWPERILDIFRTHCEDYEDAQELQRAYVTMWKTSRTIKKRREIEHNDTYGATQQGCAIPQELSNKSTDGAASGKRKRDEMDTSSEMPIKKNKPDVYESVEVDMAEQPQAVAPALKRDRENATIIVQNLPADVQPVKIRQYFRDCGIINGLQISSADNGKSSIATIEFESREDVLAARTKDLRMFEDRSISVHVTEQRTLFVTNFPSIADELWIRKRFSKYGHVVEVRFPSLKFDTHRRFCYVQFTSASEAKAATYEDGAKIDDKHDLVAKLSDPAKKKARSGALYEGREVYVSNVDWNSSESEIQELFSIYGNIDQVRIPVKVNGQSKGITFIVFSNKEEAEAALVMNGTTYKGRTLRAEIASDKQAKRQATMIVQQASRSSRSSVSTPGPLQENVRLGNGSSASPGPSSASDIASRTVALLEVPDTINDSRIRNLAEPYGNLIKIVLRLDHQGAIVEYTDTVSAGKAMLGLDHCEIVPGRKIHTGSVPELLRHKAEYKSDKLSAQGQQGPATGLLHPSSMPIRRPGQPGARRGGKGGLGLKNSGVGLSGPRAGTAAGTGKKASPGAEAMGDSAVGQRTAMQGAKPKSNSDFKALFSRQE